jgi:methylenetetrahydrofolate dehydrogenase (NADP+)/methenyltetrahydrofolate cyclohydrolase
MNRIMTVLLDGKKVAGELEAHIREVVAKSSRKLTLVIIQIGDKEESSVYIKQKKKFGERVGIEVDHVMIPEDVSMDEALLTIAKQNENEDVLGIILQLPIPKHLDSSALIDAISLQKDVDGMTARSVKALVEGKSGMVPATTRGILALLEHYKIEVSGKRVLVVGRSTLVGRPTALALITAGATVTVAHRATRDLVEEVKRADIVITAIGAPKFFDSSYFREGQVVIDVGINRQDGVLVGDVDFEGVQNLVASITPVPGGVGPMTVASLFLNLIDTINK